MRDYSPRYVSILTCGLRGDSRVLMAISGENTSIDTKLNAIIADNLSWLVWSKTKDGEHNRNKPKSIFDAITGNNEISQNNNVVKYSSIEEFEQARARILEGK